MHLTVNTTYKQEVTYEHKNKTSVGTECAGGGTNLLSERRRVTAGAHKLLWGSPWRPEWTDCFFSLSSSLLFLCLFLCQYSVSTLQHRSSLYTYISFIALETLNLKIHPQKHGPWKFSLDILFKTLPSGIFDWRIFGHVVSLSCQERWHWHFCGQNVTAPSSGFRKVITHQSSCLCFLLHHSDAGGGCWEFRKVKKTTHTY